MNGLAGSGEGGTGEGSRKPGGLQDSLSLPASS